MSEPPPSLPPAPLSPDARLPATAQVARRWINIRVVLLLAALTALISTSVIVVDAFSPRHRPGPISTTTRGE